MAQPAPDVEGSSGEEDKKESAQYANAQHDDFGRSPPVVCINQPTVRSRGGVRGDPVVWSSMRCWEAVME